MKIHMTPTLHLLSILAFGGLTQCSAVSYNCNNKPFAPVKYNNKLGKTCADVANNPQKRCIKTDEFRDKPIAEVCGIECNHITGCLSTTAPTSVPTSAPTSAPTTPPTLAPTSGPTTPPTLTPTSGPTTPLECQLREMPLEVRVSQDEGNYKITSDAGVNYDGLSISFMDIYRNEELFSIALDSLYGEDNTYVQASLCVPRTCIFADIPGIIDPSPDAPDSSLLGLQFDVTAHYDNSREISYVFGGDRVYLGLAGDSCLDTTMYDCTADNNLLGWSDCPGDCPNGNRLFLDVREDEGLADNSVLLNLTDTTTGDVHSLEVGTFLGSKQSSLSICLPTSCYHIDDFGDVPGLFMFVHTIFTGSSQIRSFRFLDGKMSTFGGIDIGLTC